MQDVVQWLKDNGNLKIIDTPLDVELEIPHVAYVEVKTDDSRPILFTKPINRAKGIEYDMPVLMNIFASKALTEKIFAKHPDELAKGIDALLKLKPPKGLKAKLAMLPKLFSLKNVFPKRLKGRGECQEVIIPKAEVDLDKLPILKTWEEDGGAFITMGQVYTQSLDGEMQNLGMYRLQQYDKNRLGMHWQIHKDASHFFDQYHRAGKKMPITVAIGGDPLYIWCGQAPMPHGMFEMLLYGFVRNKNAQLVKSISNDIYIPRDVDVVIEGFVDPELTEIEGPFGDHTGYYTLKEPFPVMEVETITMKKHPVFQATVVGKPPLEDKYMGWATERIFLPMLKPMAPDLIDYNMPENGVFHNLIMAKMKTLYKGHAMQFMHAFWGVGQMSFVKHALFVGEDAPELEEFEALSEHILNRLSPERVFITKGIVDHLDHSSSEQFVGGKLGVDATADEVEEGVTTPLDDATLLAKMQEIDANIADLRQYYTQTKNPVCVVSVNKTHSQLKTIEKLAHLEAHIKLLIIVPFIAVDATNKGELDGFKREWPGDTFCTKSVLDDLQAKGLIDIDEVFIKKFGLLPF